MERCGPTWSDSRIRTRVSRDNAATWSPSTVLPGEPGTMVRARPIVLSDGDYLLPAYRETGHDREFVGAETASFFLRYSVKTGVWTPTEPIHSRTGNLQPAVAQADGERLVCYCRRGGGYGPCHDGYLVRSESLDGGRTWSPGRDSPFPNPNAAADFIRLADGRLLLVYNDSMTARAPLTAAVSLDSDDTYPLRRDLIAGPGPYAYPTVIQTRDGSLHVIFTSEGRTAIYHALFEESVLGEPDNKVTKQTK